MKQQLVYEGTKGRLNIPRTADESGFEYLVQLSFFCHHMKLPNLSAECELRSVKPSELLYLRTQAGKNVLLNSTRRLNIILDIT